MATLMHDLTGIALGYSIFKLMEALVAYLIWEKLDWQERKLKKEREKLDELDKKIKDE